MLLTSVSLQEKLFEVMKDQGLRPGRETLPFFVSGLQVDGQTGNRVLNRLFRIEDHIDLLGLKDKIRDSYSM